MSTPRTPTVERLDLAVARWSLRPAGTVRRGSDTLLLDVLTDDGRRAVLKVGRRVIAVRRQIAAMRAFGDLAAPLLDAADDIGALLVERVVPGTPLSVGLEADDDGATHAVASLVADLRRVDTVAGLPALTRAVPAWLAHARRPQVSAAVGLARLDRATALARELLAEPSRPVVLHGDLHHDNVLAATHRPHVVIDPFGLVGDPTFDLACLLHNPMTPTGRGADPVLRLGRRVAVLGERLGDARERILAWAYVYAVVSAAWSANAAEEPGPVLPVADAALRAMLRGTRRQLSRESAIARSRRPS